MTTPQQPDKEAIEIHCHGIESMKPEQQQAIGKMCKLAAEHFGKPHPASENKGDGIKKAAIELRSALHDVALDLDELPVIENIIRKFFVTREEHERVKGIVEKAYLEGYATALDLVERNAPINPLKIKGWAWNQSEVKKELEG